MSEPYLILHKVRGEPAFDIAERLEQSSENSGADWWIIPTSGHRAYPLDHWPLSLLDTLAEHFPFNGQANATRHELWTALPDHYAINDAPKPKPSVRVPTTTDDFLV